MCFEKEKYFEVLNTLKENCFKKKKKNLLTTTKIGTDLVPKYLLVPSKHISLLKKITFVANGTI